MSGGYQQFFRDAKKNKSSEAPEKKNKSAKMDLEDQLRLALKLNRKKQARAKKSNSVPYLSVTAAILLLVVSLTGYMHPEALVKLWNSVEIKAVSLAGAQSGPAQENMTATNEENPANMSSPDLLGEPVAEAESTRWTEEDISHFSKLNERRRELDQRERELNRLEAELHKQKVELEERLKKLEQVRVEISRTLQDRVKMDQERINTLVEVYSNMKPAQAAGVFEELNEDLAIEILGKMRRKNAADILNLMDPSKARTLSEKFTGYKR